MKVVFSEDNIIFKESSLNSDTIKPLHLTNNKEYTVLGIDFLDSSKINYMLVDDCDTYYPMFYSIDFFKITDKRISKYWYNKDLLSNGTKKGLVSFKEAVTDEYFFEHLIDGDHQTIDLFKNYKILLDFEFPNETFLVAEIIEKNWLICPHCSEIWENKGTQGVIQCPNGHFCNNPLYVRCEEINICQRINKNNMLDLSIDL
mgnify:FL=1